MAPALFLAGSTINFDFAYKVLPMPEIQNVAMPVKIARYKDYKEYENELKSLVTNSAGKMRYNSDRSSAAGNYPLYWLEIGNSSNPTIFIITGLHMTNEWELPHVVMSFVNKLISADDNQSAFNKYILSNYHLVIIPMANPWGYFADPKGAHHNGRTASVPVSQRITWHRNTNYNTYYGVNLNRNFDIGFNKYQDLPQAAKPYWNGKDYGIANYFMKPVKGQLKPDALQYDYKGPSPFSEPETQLIRDLFLEYKPIAFFDWHKMNPWQTNNTSLLPTKYYDQTKVLIQQAVSRVNYRHGANIEGTVFMKLETYADGGPYALNWGSTKMGALGFGWETGSNYPTPVWTDAYMEMIYRSIEWSIKTQNDDDRRNIQQV